MQLQFFLIFPKLFSYAATVLFLTELILWKGTYNSASRTKQSLSRDTRQSQCEVKSTDGGGIVVGPSSVMQTLLKRQTRCTEQAHQSHHHLPSIEGQFTDVS